MLLIIRLGGSRQSSDDNARRRNAPAFYVLLWVRGAKRAGVIRIRPPHHYDLFCPERETQHGAIATGTDVANARQLSLPHALELDHLPWRAGGGPNQNVGPGWTSLVFLQCLFFGITLLSLGPVGRYIARIYEESKSRPLYVLSQAVNLDIGTYSITRSGNILNGLSSNLTPGTCTAP